MRKSIIVIALVFAPIPALAAVVFDQSAYTSFGFTSDLSIGVRTYSPFEIDRDAAVNRVSWTGDRNNVTSATQYQIRFALAGAPFTAEIGTILFEETAVASRTAPRPFPDTNSIIYQFNEIDLSSAVSLMAGTRYLFSVAALGADPFSYGWNQFSSGGVSITDTPGPGAFLNSGLASFALYEDGAAAVPAPSALCLFGLACVALLHRRAR